ncbi:MAG: hypothetical protein GY856_37225 [bacterium]|nr:hypothetical protein [bacterium]
MKSSFFSFYPQQAMPGSALGIKSTAAAAPLASAQEADPSTPAVQGTGDQTGAGQPGHGRIMAAFELIVK